MSTSEENGPVGLDNEQVPPRITYLPRFNGWWIVLAVLPVFVLRYYRVTRRASDNHWVDAMFDAATWAALAIGARAMVGLVRRERTWVWLVYLALYFALPTVAEVATKWAWKLGW